MREIKFRAWFPVTKELKNVAMSNLYTGRSTWLHLEPQPFSNYKQVKIMQYTGLKDKNGREIYEDDIVSYTKIFYTDCSRTEIEDVQEPIIGAIYYAEGVWLGIKNEDGTGKLFLPGQVSSKENNLEIKIIGNFYENPELLGDTK